MPADQVDWTSAGGWIFAGVTALVGWVARGVRLGSQWGAMETEVRKLREDLVDFKATFTAHLAKDETAQQALDTRLNGLSRDLNQLIGRMEVLRKEHTP